MTGWDRARSQAVGGLCATCRRMFTLRLDGKVRMHQVEWGLGHCPGSGQDPRPRSLVRHVVDDAIVAFFTTGATVVDRQEVTHAHDGTPFLDDGRGADHWLHSPGVAKDLSLLVAHRLRAEGLLVEGL